MPELSVDVLLLLALVAGAAGFIDAIAGGGGLLTIPALLVAGLNPVQAIATNKLQACFGGFTATRFFIREGLVNPGRQRWSIALTAAGGAAGAVAVISGPARWGGDEKAADAGTSGGLLVCYFRPSHDCWIASPTS